MNIRGKLQVWSFLNFFVDNNNKINFLPILKLFFDTLTEVFQICCFGSYTLFFKLWSKSRLERLQI